MPPSKTQRWLDILAVLIGNRYPVPVDRLMEDVPAYRERWLGGGETERNSVRRMFERDKDALRRIGIPLATRPCRHDGEEMKGYCIARRDFYLPYLRLLGDEEAPCGVDPLESVTLSEDDVRIAVRALREVVRLPSFPFLAEARTALRKLTFDLDPVLASLRPEAEETVRVLDRPGGSDPDRSLGVLLDGLYDRKTVTFRYHSIGRDAVAAREVEPWGLLYQGGAWYLVGRDAAADAPDPGRTDARLFRLDRMSQAGRLRPGGTRPEFEVPESFDLRDYGDRAAWELGGESEAPTPVEVRFQPPASRLAARNGWGEVVAEHDDGSAVRRFDAVRLDPLLRWVLSQAGEAEVISPPDAVERLRGMARDVLELYDRGTS